VKGKGLIHWHAVSRSDELLEDLRRAWPSDLGGSEGLRTSIDDADRVAYGRDLWPRHHMEVRAGRVGEHRPGLIVWPESTRQVQSVVRWAAERRIPLVPFGAGSGVCGGILPNENAVVVDLKRMARWRTLDRGAPSLEVEAGAMGLPLEEALGREGFTLGHFPSSILCSTVGGWVAARSAGQCSGYYGKIEDMVVALECVTGAGDIVSLSRRAHGVDLTPLIVGSEGIFGIVTAATLRLHPAPTARAFGAFTFPSTESGWEGMRRLFQADLRPTVSRLYDPFDAMLARMGGVKGKEGAKKSRQPPAPGVGSAALRTILRSPSALNGLIDRAGGRALGGAMLVVIFEGTGDAPTHDMNRAREILARAGARDDGEAPARRWLSHRYAVSYRQAPVYASGAWVDTMEVAATWSNLGALYEGVRRALGRHAFVMAHLSHAYPDGCCIYFSFAGSAARTHAASASSRGVDAGATWDSASLEAYERAWRDGLEAALAAGGTIAHHHGVGRSKAPELRREAGSGLDVVRAIKRVLDPGGIMNPGNLLRDEGAAPAPAGPAVAEPTRSETAMVLDTQSLLADVDGTVPLCEVERWLIAQGLTLNVIGANATDAAIGTWIADGARGARDAWLDPADHLVAGFTASFHHGSEVVVRPAPRRAVGPDLFALLSGARGRFATLTRVWVRVHELGASRASTAPFHGERDASVSDGESVLALRLEAALSAAHRDPRDATA